MRARFPRAWWIAAPIALLALVLVTFVRRGADGAELGPRALAPGLDVEASGSAPATRAADLEFEVSAPIDAPATGALEPVRTHQARVAAKVQPESTIVVGFVVTEEAHSEPLNAYRAAVSFELERGGERWTGRKLQHGHWIEARRAFGHERLDSRSGADKFLYIELHPATPRGVSLAFEVELALNADTEVPEARHRGTFRGEGTLTLTDAPYQWLPDVPCRQIGAWAAGQVLAGPHIELDGARVGVIELVSPDGLTPSLGGEILVEATHAASTAVTHGPVLADGTFSVPGPSRPSLPHMRLCVVLANGRAYVTQHPYEAFKGDLVLRIEATRTATGRLLFRGGSATGLAHLHAEQGGARVGQVSVERDGTFKLRGLPYGTFDIVIESGRPGGELLRLPSASLAGNASATTLDLGVIEVAGLAEVMELELVDRTGAPAAAHLRWRGRGGSGGVGLRAGAMHTLLLPPVVPYEMELVSAQHAAPIPLAAKPGRVRVVVGE